MSFDLLYAAQFAVSAIGTIKEHNDANAAAVQQQYQAIQQVSINNNLNHNAHLGINEEQALTLKKHGLDKWELWKQKRREEAKSAVQATQRGMRGGTPKDVGGSYAAAYNNITRHAYGALARKDLNFEAQLTDFGRRHANLDLQTINQNNAAFSNLSSGASFLGSALSVAGSGLQIANESRGGTYGAALREQKPSTASTASTSSYDGRTGTTKHGQGYGGGASRNLTGGNK